MADDAAGGQFATVNMLLARYAHTIKRLQDAMALRDRDATFLRRRSTPSVTTALT